MLKLPVAVLGNDALSTQGGQDCPHATVYDLRKR